MRAHSQGQGLSSRFSPQFTQEPASSYVIPLSEDRAEEIYISAMSRMYGLVAAGIAITAMGVWVGDILEVYKIMLGLGWLSLLLMLGVSIGMLFAAQYAASLGNLSLGTTIYLAFTGVEGMFISYITKVYELDLIALAFLMTAGLFIGMCLVGMTTKKDLSKLGPILFIALIAGIVVSVINIFMRSDAVTLAVSLGFVVVFLGLTVYETKQVKEWVEDAAAKGEDNVAACLALMGSISLYLNFLNLFMRILYLLGRARD